MSHTEIEDGVLRQAQAGDPRAFRVLYEQHCDAVYAFVLRMLRDPAASQDVLQDVFMRVLRALPRFDPHGPARLRTWILTIARRAALDVIDSGGARARLAAAVDVPAGGMRPEPDLRLTLEAAIAALPEAQRSVFVLSQCCQLRHDEVAAIEGIDVGTVKSRLHRARATLQAALVERTTHAERGADVLRACR